MTQKHDPQVVSGHHRIRQELIGYPGLLDGLSQTARAALADWIENGTPFPAIRGDLLAGKGVPAVES